MSWLRRSSGCCTGTATMACSGDDGGALVREQLPGPVLNVIRDEVEGAGKVLLAVVGLGQGVDDGDGASVEARCAPTSSSPNLAAEQARHWLHDEHRHLADLVSGLTAATIVLIQPTT